MEFDFIDEGEGPALLFLPGSYSNHAGWKAVQRALRGSYRLITTSLPGYGGTREIRSSESEITSMTDFVADVANHAGEPIHLIGHSYGGLTAFASILLGKIQPLSLITFEGNPIYLRPEQGEFPWFGEVEQMYDGFEAAYAGNDADAPKIIIDFWGGEGAFDAMPAAVPDYCRSVVFSNILDWRCAKGFRPSISEFSSFGMPCTFARGEYANRPLIDVTDKLEEVVPDSMVEVVEGSGHFLISTHPEACANIIDTHMDRFAAE